MAHEVGEKVCMRAMQRLMPLLQLEALPATSQPRANQLWRANAGLPYCRVGRVEALEAVDLLAGLGPGRGLERVRVAPVSRSVLG
jgi:hypothetical protein